jgi:outer membrane protein
MTMTTRHSLFAAALLALAARGLAAQQPSPPAASAPAPAAAPVPGPDLPRVTLEEALRRAAQYSPAMVQARQNVRTAHAQERQAFGAYLPSLSVSGNEGYTPVRIDATTGGASAAGTGTPYNQRYGYSLSLPLFTGFQRGANQRVARATADQREAAQLQQEYAVALSTKQAFFTALATAELVTVAETQLRRSGEQLRLASEKLRLGATTRADSLTATVDYGNAQLQLIQARANLQYAQVNLGRQLGLDGAIAPIPDSTLEERLGTLDPAALRREAAASAPSVQQAEASLAGARASLAASRAQYFPTITASFSQSWSRALNGMISPNAFSTTSVVRSLTSVGPPVTAREDTLTRFNTMPFTGSKSFSVSFNFPIFNGFARETNVITADANVITAQANLRDAQLALDANLTQTIAGLNSAAQQIDIARSSVAAAEENLRMQQERYRLGTSTIVDLLTSQAALNQAQANLVSARYNYLVARAQIEALVGHPL